MAMLVLRVVLDVSHLALINAFAKIFTLLLVFLTLVLFRLVVLCWRRIEQSALALSLWLRLPVSHLVCMGVILRIVANEVSRRLRLAPLTIMEIISRPLIVQIIVCVPLIVQELLTVVLVKLPLLHGLAGAS